MSDTDELTEAKELAAIELGDLRKEATELGINFNKAIGLVKLQAKVDAFYKAKEEPIEEMVDLEKAIPEEPKVSVKATTSKHKKRMMRERDARKTRVVYVIDNDQRSNSHTTTCTVNCSNQFFDLGTLVLPLNEKIEVAEGHLNILRSVKIPLHAKDPKTGLSIVKMRPRYTISYEDEA